MDNNLSANLHVLVSACQKVSRFMIRDFGEVEQLQTSINGANNFVAASQLKAEKILTDTLLESRERYGVMSPNAEVKGLDISHRFIINVSDGVENFKRGLPFFTVSVALQEQKNLIASVVYSPVLDKMFFAEKGSGCFVSETRMTRRIRVSPRRDLFGATVVSVDSNDVFSGARRLDIGSSALSLGYVSAGMADAFVSRKCNVFELAAGLLMVKEAGGIIRAYDAKGNETQDVFGADTVVCGNSYLQSEIKSCIIKK